MTEEAEDFVEYDEEVPILSPVQIVGGGISIGVNPNLDLDEPIVTFEAVSMIADEGGPELAMIPILMTTAVWDMLTSTVTYLNPEQTDQ